MPILWLLISMGRQEQLPWSPRSLWHHATSWIQKTHLTFLGKKARNRGFLDIGVKGLYWVEIWWSCNCRWIKESVFVLLQLCGSKWEAFSKSWWKCYFSAPRKDEHRLEFQSSNLEAAFVENHVLPDAALLQDMGTPFSVMPGGVSMGDGSCNSDSLVPASWSTGDLHPRCLGQG